MPHPVVETTFLVGRFYGWDERRWVRDAGDPRRFLTLVTAQTRFPSASNVASPTHFALSLRSPIMYSGRMIMTSSLDYHDTSELNAIRTLASHVSVRCRHWLPDFQPSRHNTHLGSSRLRRETACVSHRDFSCSPGRPMECFTRTLARHTTPTPSSPFLREWRFRFAMFTQGQHP